MSRIPAAGVRAHDDLPDVDTMIDRLAARLSDTPEDGEGWKMLGWSLLHTDRPGDAANAYAKARTLMPTSEDVAASLAEAIIARDAGAVGDEAQAVIDDVLRLAPELPKARYFKALARSQRGEPAAALSDMKAIEAGADGDALWVEQMRARIAQLSASLARASE
jgi:cytochrome c-type biogenesis protein CcmH